MALAAGERVGPYEILSQLGAGGMGEVYKARDTRLERIVAIKVLSPRMSILPEARERFEREARTIANLRHPNICVLYDIGKHNGADYLVLEYLEGDTLASRLALGPLPLEQVLRYAIEIADALDQAHRHGATHRDVKPGNIMLARDGSQTSSKLLDFGLAKLKQEVAPSLPLSEMPTLGAPLTGGGMIIGTVQYMAPEQVEGKTDEVDGRTDIFSFGATLYEMATGKKAFEGKTQASIMASILKEDPPPVSASQPEGKVFPPALDRVVKRCLAKDPADRWQSASDLTEALKWIRDASLPTTPPTAPAAENVAAPPPPTPALWQRPGIIAAIALVACLATALGVWILRPAPAAPPRPVERLTVALPLDATVSQGMNDLLAFSPDGKRLAYVALGSGGQQLYVRVMDGLEATPLAGTEGATHPFFSPDGEWIGFFGTNGLVLKKISASGGTPLTLCNLPANTQGGTWGPDDAIVFATSVTAGLSKVSAAGGQPETFTTLLPGETGHRWPQFLPDGKTIAFTVGTSTNYDEAQIAVQRLDSREHQIVVRGGTYGRYVPTGHLVYYRAGTIMAVPFDPVALDLKGSASPVVEDVLGNNGSGAANFSFSNSGSLAYLLGGAQSITQQTMVWVSRQGVATPLPAPLRAYRAPRISPDGRQIAVGIGTDVWIYDIQRDTLTRLTFEGSNAQFAANWTPDGKRVIFPSNRAGPTNLFWKPVDGSGPEERLTTSQNVQRAGSGTPDGRFRVITEVDPKTLGDLWVLPMERDPSTGSERPGKPRLFLQTQFYEDSAQFSPDGRWIGYTSTESGRLEVYVRPFPGPGGKWQISTEGGSELMWNPKGKELFYRTGANKTKMMVVEYETQPTFSAGKPRLLFEGNYTANAPTAGGALYSVSPDGQRFLMTKAVEQPQAALAQINVVLNWFEELKAKVQLAK